MFRTAAQDLFSRTLEPGPLPMQTLRNADFQEVALEVDGKTVLRFALAYGFRNIQTLVRQIKRGVCKYDYIEVMACPSGCLNGGGQIKAAAGKPAAQLIDELDQLYHNGTEVWVRAPQENPVLQALYRDWVAGEVYGKAAQHMLHTIYSERSQPAQTVVTDW